MHKLEMIKGSSLACVNSLAASDNHQPDNHLVIYKEFFLMGKNRYYLFIIRTGIAKSMRKQFRMRRGIPDSPGLYIP